MNLLDVFQNRHSTRVYTGERIADTAMMMILQAGLLSASGRTIRPWELIVVRDKEALTQLASCRVGAAQMLKGADAAIAVIADEKQSDTWIEDCAIVMANMHLMSDSLGVGSCWIQGRLREAEDGRSTEAYVRDVLGYPQGFRLEAILSLGIPQNHAPRTELAELLYSKVHYESFKGE